MFWHEQILQTPQPEMLLHAPHQMAEPHPRHAVQPTAHHHTHARQQITRLRGGLLPVRQHRQQHLCGRQQRVAQRAPPPQHHATQIHLRAVLWHAPAQQHRKCNLQHHEPAVAMHQTQQTAHHPARQHLHLTLPHYHRRVAWRIIQNA